jgi:hypothetical protein
MRYSDDTSEYVKGWLDGQAVAFEMLEKKFGLVEIGRAIDNFKEGRREGRAEGFAEGYAHLREKVLDAGSLSDIYYMLYKDEMSKESRNDSED